jgi:hypothetical protein
MARGAKRLFTSGMAEMPQIASICAPLVFSWQAILRY